MWDTRVTLSYFEISSIYVAMQDVLDRKKNIAMIWPEDAGYAEEIQKLENLLKKMDKASKRALGISDRDRSPRGQGTGRT